MRKNSEESFWEGMSGFANVKLHEKKGVAGRPHSKERNHKYTKFMVETMISCKATPTEWWKY